MDVVALQGCVKNYDWGKVGPASAVYDLMCSQLDWLAEMGYCPETTIHSQVEAPFAELWLTTHMSGTATALVDDTPTPLREFLKQQPKSLGRSTEVFSATDSHMSFILKVLSIRKALSIQAHPHKALAARLHLSDPKNYPDANHKPEIAIAVTPFEAFCGFRTPSQILEIFQNVPEITTLVGVHVRNAFIKQSQCPITGVAWDVCDKGPQCGGCPDQEARKAAVKTLFTALMLAEEDKVTQSLNALTHRLKSEGPRPHPPVIHETEGLALRLMSQFPGDIGILASFVLNYLQLRPFDGLFMGPNEPHAYLSGDCVEITACSDNVVRAGLTPKFRDVTTLCDMLTYTSGPPAIFESRPIYHHTSNNGDISCDTFSPPVSDFQVDVFRLRPSGGSLSLSIPPCDAGSIWLVTCGQGSLAFSRGEGDDVTFRCGEMRPAAFTLQKGAAFM